MVSQNRRFTFKISQFLFSRNRPGREKREYLHRAKISRYTVYAMACGQTVNTHVHIYNITSNAFNGIQHCSKKDSVLESADLVEGLLDHQEDILIDFGDPGIHSLAKLISWNLYHCGSVTCLFFSHKKAGYWQVRAG